MGISNCARCGRMYQKTLGLRYCQDCLQAEEDDFRKVRDHLETHPGMDLQAISEATEVDEAMILRFLRDGRLATVAEAAVNLKVDCVKCGMPIGGGKYCTKCMNAMSQSLSEGQRSLQMESDLPEDRERSSRTRGAETIDEKRRGDSSSFRDRR